MIHEAQYDLERASWIIDFECQFRTWVHSKIKELISCSTIDDQRICNKVFENFKTELNWSNRKNDLYVRNTLEKFIIYEVDLLQKNMAKNFGLSAADFELIISQLKSNETKFFEQAFLSHFGDCMTYLEKNFNASYDDAYDATMDTFLEFRKRLVDGKINYGNLRYLFTKMATQVYQKKMKSFKLINISEGDITPDQPIYDDEDMSVLHKAWEQLGVQCKHLLQCHYYGKMKLTEIAVQDNKSSVAVRKQKERCISRLKTLFIKVSKNYQHG